MRAISVFSLEAGTSTLGWRAWIALRTRVSMSAMGSIVIVLLVQYFDAKARRGREERKSLPRVFLCDSASPRQKHGSSSSPARLHHARNLSIQRQLAEA